MSMFAQKCRQRRRSLATIRPLRYELAGRGLPHYDRSHSCSSTTFSRPDLSHLVPLVRVGSTVFRVPIRGQPTERQVQPSLGRFSWIIVLSMNDRAPRRCV
jgi:hypothetical protein